MRRVHENKGYGDAVWILSGACWAIFKEISEMLQFSPGLQSFEKNPVFLIQCEKGKSLWYTIIRGKIKRLLASLNQQHGLKGKLKIVCFNQRGHLKEWYLTFHTVSNRHRTQ